jgi:putative tricarboxylic transport membrane protein
VRFHDALSGLLTLLFGIAVIAYARSFPVTPGQPIGPGLFPMLIGGAMALCGVALFASSVRSRITPWLQIDEWVRRPRRVLNGALVIGALVFYALAVDTLGFFLTALVFLTVLFLALEVPRRWIAPIAVGMTLGLHFAFYTLLRVPLPWGWLEGIAW